jgi:type I restriction enzyme S subunit
MKDKEGTEKMKQPEVFKVEKLKDVADIIMGQSPPSDTYNKDKIGLPFFQGKAEFGAIFPQVKIYCSNPQKVAKKNDILMSVRAPVGSINIADTECCIGRGLCAMRGGNNLDYMYLYYFLKTNEVRISLKGTGSTFTAIDTKTIQKLEIPVPSIPEQQKIVDKLNKQMAQIEIMKKEAEEQRAVLELLFESIINKEMQALKLNLLDKCNFVKLEDICNLRTGGTPSKSQPEYFGGDIKWIVSGDLNKEFIYDVDGRITDLGYKNSNARMLPEDSVLMALNGQGKTRGMVAVLKTEATCNQSIIAFIPKNRAEMDYVFLFYYLKGCYQKLRNLTGDKERSGLSMSTLRPFQVIVPSIDIQRKVADKLQKKYDEIREISISLQKQKKSIDELPASILNEVFGQYQINS